MIYAKCHMEHNYWPHHVGYYLLLSYCVRDMLNVIHP